MALIRVNACGLHARLHGTGAPPDRAIAGLLAQDGPVIVMVHGFRYAPGVTGHCPHETIFSRRRDTFAPEDLARLGDLPDTPECAWPGQLGVGAGRLGLALGWSARGTIWQAHEEAARAALALAHVLRLVRDCDPRREVHAIGHSLGARVILQALHHLPAGTLQRVILLSAADYAGPSLAALSSPAGRRARVLHVTSGENRAYELGLRSLLQPNCIGDRILGLDTPEALPTLRLDAPDHLAALERAGFAVAPPMRRVCHWSSYRRPGVFALYRALTGPGGAELHDRIARIPARRAAEGKPPRRMAPLLRLGHLPRGANPS